jgi:hypothetical protein
MTEKPIHVKYPLVFESFAEWKNCDLPIDLILGPSPGGAAADLYVSRQGIYNFVKAGFLDRVTVKGGKHGIDSVFITTASVRRMNRILTCYRLEFGMQGLKGSKGLDNYIQQALKQNDLFDYIDL